MRIRRWASRCSRHGSTRWPRASLSNVHANSARARPRCSPALHSTAPGPGAPRRGRIDRARTVARQAESVDLPGRGLDRVCGAQLCGVDRTGAAGARHEPANVARACRDRRRTGDARPSCRSPNEYLAEPARDFGLAGLAVVEHKLGNTAAASQALRSMRTEGDRMLYQQAQILAQWGQVDAAMDGWNGHGERRLRAHLCAQRSVPDPLRGDPRFAQLLKRVGFA